MTDAVKWGPGKKQAFLDWMDYELTSANQARMGLEAQWRQWLIQYRPPAKSQTKSFPYEGAFGYTLPLTAGDVDPLFASFMQTLHASEDLWSVQALNERWEDAAKPMQDFLTWLDHSVLKMYQVNKKALLEMVKLGTAIYKTGWTYEKRPYRTYDSQGKFKIVSRVVSRPFVDHVSLADFIIPPSATAIQPDDQGGAAWVAERVRVNVQRLRSIANASDPLVPMMAKEDLDLVLAMEERVLTLHREQIQALDYQRKTIQAGQSFDRDVPVGITTGSGGVAPYVREVELYEIHARFPTQGDSEDDIIVLYHKPTRTVLRAQYQPFHHGQRPYDAVRYFPGDGFYGIGVCEQKEMFQSLASDLFNFTGDNVLLVNSRTYATRAGSNIAPGEPIFPGKIFVTDGPPKDDLVAMAMAEVYPSLPQLIQFVLSIGRERTGVSDLQRGSLESLPSRTPASSLQSLLQEGKRRPDLTIKDLRYSGISTIGLRMIQLMQQYIGRVKENSVGAEQYLRLAVEVLGLPEGQLVVEKLQTPLEDAALGLGVSINAVSGTANKDMERQTLQNLLALNTQVGPQMIQMMQMAMQMNGSPVGQAALEVAQGTAKLYTKLLEQHDIRDPESITPEIPEALPPAGVPGGDPNAQGVGGQPGMAGVQEGAGAPF